MNIENESYGQGQNFPGTCVDKEVIEKDKKIVGKIPMHRERFM